MEPIKAESEEKQEQPLLSRWWRTESAQRAFERARQKSQERIKKVREHFEQKRETLKRDVDSWKVQEVPA